LYNFFNLSRQFDIRECYVDSTLTVLDKMNLLVQFYQDHSFHEKSVFGSYLISLSHPRLSGSCSICRTLSIGITDDNSREAMRRRWLFCREIIRNQLDQPLPHDHTFYPLHLKALKGLISTRWTWTWWDAEDGIERSWWAPRDPPRSEYIHRFRSALYVDINQSVTFIGDKPLTAGLSYFEVEILCPMRMSRALDTRDDYVTPLDDFLTRSFTIGLIHRVPDRYEPELFVISSNGFTSNETFRYCRHFDVGDVISVITDTRNFTLRYAINGIDQGIAFTDVGCNPESILRPYFSVTKGLLAFDTRGKRCQPTTLQSRCRAIILDHLTPRFFSGKESEKDSLKAKIQYLTLPKDFKKLLIEEL